MHHTTRAYGGMAVAPHHLASQSGAAVLREGGNAVEAMLAMAATIAVVYPHMNGIGGDGFWLISSPDATPIAIQACGPAASAATRAFYADRELDVIPSRGGLAALTVAGTVSGWQVAIEVAQEMGGRLPLDRLLSDAVHHAREGIAVTTSQATLTADKLGELRNAPGFGQVFLLDGQPPPREARLRNPALAATLQHLSRVGLDDFYRGSVARSLAADLQRAGSLLALSDLETFSARRAEPLSVRLREATLFNLPPPTQGLASLLILAICERLGVNEPEDRAAFIHRIVEATKQAFIVRDKQVFDPAYMKARPSDLLAENEIDRMAGRIELERAAPWPHRGNAGDTIWMGAVDAEGRAVSFIQSLYWEFGSGVISPSTGIVWQNRGTSFSLDPDHPNRLEPGRLPFHTLNPALARFDDGRVMVYGTMGGDGQPQTQAAIFSRYVWSGHELQAAVSAPRWLLGRTWGSESVTLKLESRFSPELADRLRRWGHSIEMVDDYSDLMGHAGAIVRHADGLMEGASDPRSDGSAAAV